MILRCVEWGPREENRWSFGFREPLYSNHMEVIISGQARATLAYKDYAMPNPLSQGPFLQLKFPVCIHPFFQVLQRTSSKSIPTNPSASASQLAKTEKLKLQSLQGGISSLPCRRLDWRFIQTSASPLVSFPACNACILAAYECNRQLPLLCHFFSYLF